MTQPGLIDRRGLLNWADSIGARSELPRLIRRLMLETGKGVVELGFPAGEGVAAASWDGTVRASEDALYVPQGCPCGNSPSKSRLARRPTTTMQSERPPLTDRQRPMQSTLLSHSDPGSSEGSGHKASPETDGGGRSVRWASMMSTLGWSRHPSLTPGCRRRLGSGPTGLSPRRHGGSDGLPRPPRPSPRRPSSPDGTKKLRPYAVHCRRRVDF
jgi:hypothetical protein